jgi:hypothetical protein
MNAQTIIKKIRRNRDETDHKKEMLIEAQKGKHIAET